MQLDYTSMAGVIEQHESHKIVDHAAVVGVERGAYVVWQPELRNQYWTPTGISLLAWLAG